MSALAKANLLVLVLLVAHTLDHAINQPSRAQPESAALVGLLGFVIIGASSVLAIRGSKRAPLASLFAGMVTFWGVVAVHLAPQWWEWLSDPYWGFATNAGNWISLVALLAAAAWLEVAGIRALAGATGRADLGHADNAAAEPGH